MGDRSFLSTFLVGAGFAFGWSPCIGPILGTILTLAGGHETWAQGTFLLAVYSAGLAIPFLAAGWSLDSFLRTFGRLRLHLRKIEVGSGVLLMAVGTLLMTGQLARLNSQFSFMIDLLSAAERGLQ
jgi:cytochrome c-type biogenesis protein